QTYVEEVGAMNIFFVYGDTLRTPKLTGSILPGITRDSVLKLAARMGRQAVEERMAVDTVLKDIASGAITEAFGAGTAAVISPVKAFSFKGTTYTVGNGGIGTVSQRLYDTLTGIQYGRAPDPFSWITKLS
ncbi:MAG: branched chain amino acid aminotransferase, partial [Clostridiales bacterium]|nr:branched chain amino acid aminotransferase [Clostridiales bacterium]